MPHESAVRRLRLLFHVRPHAQFIAVRVSKMKSTPAGERKCLLHNRSAGGLDFLLDRGQITRVNHQQQALAWRRRILRKASGQAAVEKARVIGTIILKGPPEDGSVELLVFVDLSCRQFNIVDWVFVSWSAHGLLILRPSSPFLRLPVFKEIEVPGLSRSRQVLADRKST